MNTPKIELNITINGTSAIVEAVAPKPNASTFHNVTENENIPEEEICHFEVYNKQTDETTCFSGQYNAEQKAFIVHLYGGGIDLVPLSVVSRWKVIEY